MGDAELAGSVELKLRRGALQRRGYTTPRLGEDRFRSVVMAGLRHPRRVKSGLRCSTGDREAATIGVPCADADVFLVLVSP
jgi:hypothetical protein